MAAMDARWRSRDRRCGRRDRAVRAHTRLAVGRRGSRRHPTCAGIPACRGPVKASARDTARADLLVGIRDLPGLARTGSQNDRRVDDNKNLVDERSHTRTLRGRFAAAQLAAVDVVGNHAVDGRDRRERRRATLTAPEVAEPARASAATPSPPIASATAAILRRRDAPGVRNTRPNGCAPPSARVKQRV